MAIHITIVTSEISFTLMALSGLLAANAAAADRTGNAPFDDDSGAMATAAAVAAGDEPAANFLSPL